MYFFIQREYTSKGGMKDLLYSMQETEEKIKGKLRWDQKLLLDECARHEWQWYDWTNL